MNPRSAHDQARVWLNPCPQPTPPTHEAHARLLLDRLQAGEQLVRAMLAEWDANRIPSPVPPAPPPPLRERPAPAPAYNREREIAKCEGAEWAASDSYFNARPDSDTREGRRVFEAGFVRGYNAAKGFAP